MRLSMANSAVGGWCALLDVWEKISSGRVDVNILKRFPTKELDFIPPPNRPR